MAHNKFKTRVIASGMILAGLLVVQSAQSDQSSVFFEQEHVVLDNELAGQSGQGLKDTSAISNANLNNNTITVNSGGSITNGNNNISGQAFSGASGIATAIQNSGNNVLIQNQTVVNVTLQ